MKYNEKKLYQIQTIDFMLKFIIEKYFWNVLQDGVPKKNV